MAQLVKLPPELSKAESVSMSRYRIFGNLSASLFIQPASLADICANLADRTEARIKRWEHHISFWRCNKGCQILFDRYIGLRVPRS